MLRTTPTPTLFPYTTLFRSKARNQRSRSVPKRIRPCCQLDPPTRERRWIEHSKAPRCRETTSWRATTARARTTMSIPRSEEHTSELQSRGHLVCRLLLEKKKKQTDVECDKTQTK